MRILVVTGRLASEGVKAAVKASGVLADVYVADCDVASLMPWSEVLRALEYAKLHGYDVVVVPGTLPASADDLREASKEYGVVVVKGPRELPLLPTALRRIAERSPTPGEVVEGAPTRLDVLKVLESLEAECIESSCGLCIPLRPPPIHVWYEVFAWKGLDEAVDRAAEKACMAHVVVLGVSAEADRSEVLRALRRLLDSTSCVGLDSPSPKMLVEAARTGACVTMSVSPETSQLMDELPPGTVVVLTPAPPGMVSTLSAAERAESLARLVERALSKSLVPVADPVLESPLAGLARSLEAYLVASKAVRAPLLAGIGNVYELLDADSHGVVGLLVPLVAELGVSVILASEESWKARGALVEAVTASIMASAAMLLKTTPKDLGVDLLLAKEKRPRRASVPVAREVVEAWRAPRVELERDPAGDLLVGVDPDERVILVTLVKNGRPRLTLKAKSAEEAYRAAVALGMVSRLDHAAYLGRELARAELCLELGIGYAQDSIPLSSVERRATGLARGYVEVTARPKRREPTSARRA